MPCCRCGRLIVSAAAVVRDAIDALCLPCLEDFPAASFGQRLKALRLARGLSRATLECLTGLNRKTV
jgi:hypothetical protein